MKRHPSLAVLSREHHGALILARLLKKGAPAYKGLPSDITGKAGYAIDFYDKELAAHFKQEEEVLIGKTRGTDAMIDHLAAEITGEHRQLEILFRSIKNSKELVNLLDELGSLLERHIRKEEREFFPLVQEICSEQLLAEIGKAFSVDPPPAKKDIENMEDIKLLVNSFYGKVKADPVIGFLFKDIVKVNWERHLPVMYNFWENTLFFTGNYTGNPLDSHKRLHQLFPLNAKHFEQWNKLFAATVDEHFSGAKANLARQRAFSISTVMKIKITAEQTDTNKVF